MRNHLFIVLAICKLVFWVSVPCLLGADAVKAEDIDWSWECELPDKTFGYFGIIPVRTTLTNRSKHSVNLQRNFLHAHYGFTIKDRNGNIVKATEEGEKLLHPDLFHGHVKVTLKPSEACRNWIDLRSYFNLNFGSYTLQISYHIVAEDPDGKRKDVVIDKVSPVMKFEVVQNAP